MGLLDAPSVALSVRGRQQLASKITTPLRGFHLALANRANARCDVVVVGDSLAAGEGATTYLNGWTRVLPVEVRRRLGMAAGGVGYINASNTGVTTFTWPGAITGALVTDANYGPPRRATVLITGKSITFTIPGNHTDVDIMGPMNSGLGTFSWAVDGGGATNVSENSGTLRDGQLTRISLGASGSHSLVLPWVSGGSVYIDGIIAYNNDASAGFMVHDAGHFGWNTGTGGSGWTQGANGVDQWPRALAALSPDLIILPLGTNDVTSGVGITASQFQTNLTTLIGLIRAGTGFPSPQPPIVLLAYPARTTYKTAWADYVNAMWAIAAADPLVTVCDLFTRLPSYDDSPNYSMHQADGVHFTDKGHAAVADAVAGFLIPTL